MKPIEEMTDEELKAEFLREISRLSPEKLKAVGQTMKLMASEVGR